MKILFKNCSYLDVINEKIIEDIDILIENDLITKIDQSINTKADKIFEGKDLLLTPGFINCHTHLGMTYFRNYADDLDLDTWLNESIWPMEAHLTGEDIYWASMLSLAEQVMSGTTCFSDMYDAMNRVGDAALDVGVRGVLAKGVTGFVDRDKKLELTKKLYKEYHNKGNGQLKVVPGPHAIYTCDADFLKSLFELAETWDQMVHIHASETLKELEDAKEKYNKTPINYLLDLGLDKLHTIAAHCVYMTEDEMERIDKEKFFPVYNPTSNLKLASGFTPISEMQRHGITIALGTDGSSSNNNQDMMEEIHIASIVNKAVDLDPESVKAIDVLKMATINGAKALGWEHEIGSIEEGKKADIAVFNLNSPRFTPRNNLISALCYSASSEDIVHVIINGKIIMEDRNILTIDLDKVLEQVNLHMTQLEQRFKE